METAKVAGWPAADMDERVERTIESYEAVADEYQSRHGDRADVAPIVEAFHERVAEATAGARRPPRILDVGCGPGWESATFAEAGFEVVGIDISPSFLAAATDRAPAADFLRGDMRSLPVDDTAADGLFALASLLHVPEAEVDETLAEFVRVLEPGGVLTLVTKRTGADPPESPYGDRDRRYFEYYEPDGLRDRLERAGFTIDAMSPTERWIPVHAHVE